MTVDELEDMLICDLPLRIYTRGIGYFVEGSVCTVHWPAASDAFLLEVIEHMVGAPDQCHFYSIERGDPSLIVERA